MTALMYEPIKKSQAFLRKFMSFKEKIDKILTDNKLGINSVNGLEKAIGASTGSVAKYYKTDSEPGLGTIKKIKKTFAISDRDWDTARTGSEAFVLPKEIGSNDVRVIPADVWEELKTNNAVFKVEIDRLWSLVNRLTAEPVRANK